MKKFAAIITVAVAAFCYIVAYCRGGNRHAKLEPKTA